LPRLVSRSRKHDTPAPPLSRQGGRTVESETGRIHIIYKPIQRFNEIKNPFKQQEKKQRETSNHLKMIEDCTYGIGTMSPFEKCDKTMDNICNSLVS
jgi:hypothetical protein